jgi:hypothetical protein
VLLKKTEKTMFCPAWGVSAGVKRTVSTAPAKAMVWKKTIKTAAAKILIFPNLPCFGN